ncbi:aldolase/citrate lyase family protein [Polaromonas sp. P1(28)-13]|nr:aldolase/citrate lyase family protein [Polaromonas sp. P1(28)-13]
MVETPEAVTNAAAIAAVDGVDAVFVGPNDLSHSMGFGNDWNAPAVQAAIEQALRSITAAGKCAGIIALTPEDEDKYGQLGARYFASVTTSIISRAFKQAAHTGRAADAAIAY